MACYRRRRRLASRKYARLLPCSLIVPSLARGGRAPCRRSAQGCARLSKEAPCGLEARPQQPPHLLWRGPRRGAIIRRLQQPIARSTDNWQPTTDSRRRASAPHRARRWPERAALRSNASAWPASMGWARGAGPSAGVVRLGTSRWGERGNRRPERLPVSCGMNCGGRADRVG